MVAPPGAAPISIPDVLPALKQADTQHRRAVECDKRQA